MWGTETKLLAWSIGCAYPIPKLAEPTPKCLNYKAPNYYHAQPLLPLVWWANFLLLGTILEEFYFPTADSSLTPWGSQRFLLATIGGRGDSITTQERDGPPPGPQQLI